MRISPQIFTQTLVAICNDPFRWLSDSFNFIRKNHITDTQFCFSFHSIRAARKIDTQNVNNKRIERILDERCWGGKLSLGDHALNENTAMRYKPISDE